MSRKNKGKSQEEPLSLDDDHPQPEEITVEELHEAQLKTEAEEAVYIPAMSQQLRDDLLDRLRARESYRR